jgi:hypothetical protein
MVLGWERNDGWLGMGQDGMGNGCNFNDCISMGGWTVFLRLRLCLIE